MTAQRTLFDPRYERLFGDVSVELLNLWKIFHAANPQVYEAFKHYTYEIKKAGWEHYSHWAVANQVRWHFDTRIKGEFPFKLSNDFITVYARVLTWNHADLEGFFTLKKCKKNRKVWKGKKKP